MKNPIQRPDWQELRQIPLDLQIDESDPAYVTLEEANLRSQTAKNALTNMKKEAQEWFGTYTDLLKAGFKWRVACYIAWASSPRNTRWPATQEELAIKVLGLTSDRQIWVWRQKNPAIDETVAMLQSAELFEYRADFFRALRESAANPDYKHHNDRKLAFTMTGDHVERLKVETKRDDIEDLDLVSDAELRRIKKAKSGDSAAEDGQDESE